MNPKNENGFTLVELLVVIMLIGILFVSFGSFFTNYLYLYSDLQTDSLADIQMAQEAEHMSAVIRGVTIINSETANSISMYAYFSPADTYVSLISYFVNVAGTQVLASVTPMTANPPIGSPITSETQTYTIISNYKPPTNGSLFTYYDLGGNVLTPPVANQDDIQQISINLYTPATHSSRSQQLITTVGLRNRKVGA